MPRESVNEIPKLSNGHQVGSGPVAEVLGDAVVDGVPEGHLLIAYSG